MQDGPLRVLTLSCEHYTFVFLLVGLRGNHVYVLSVYQVVLFLHLKGSMEAFVESVNQWKEFLPSSRVMKG